MKVKSILLLILTSIFTYLYYHYNQTADFMDLRIMGSIGVSQLLLSIWTWRKFKRSIISPYIFYLFILYIFTIGQSLLYVFNFVSEQRDLVGFLGITIQDVFEAQYITLIFLSFFHIGAILSIKKVNKLPETDVRYDYSKIIIKFGWLLFIVSFIPFWYSLISTLIKSLLYGYGFLFENTDYSRGNALLKFVASYFIPSVICLFIGYKDNKLMRNLMQGVLIFITLLSLLAGGRGGAVIMMALLVLMHNYIIRKISKKGVVYIAIAGVFVLSLLSIISQTRSTSNRSIAHTFTSENTNNAALDAVAEMGGSMSTLIWTSDFVPSTENFRYGSTYLYSLTTLFPNFGFWKVHPGMVNANLGQWLTEKMALNYGTGFSMVAEAYINFGPFGWILMLFMGFIFCKILDVDNNKSLLKVLFSLIIFWTCASIARNSFLPFIRSFFFIALPIYLIIKHYSTSFVRENRSAD